MALNIDYVESLAKQFLPLDAWGFVESTRTDSLLIYNSQWCRLRFHIHVDIHHQSPTEILFIGYGRLHAADDKATMKWLGEDHYCWVNNTHELNILLQFLDGLTPKEACKKPRKPSKLFKDFETSVSTSHPNINVYELACLQQAMIWEHYEQRFFKLFDLRLPDLWEGYIDFLKEYYRLYYEALDDKLERQGQKRTPHKIPPYRRC